MSKLFIITLLLVSTFLTGCSSLHEVPTGSNDLISYDVSVGEKVVISTYSGDSYKFVVEGSTDIVIYGEGISVNIVDIKQIQTEEFSFAKTAGLVGTIAVVILSYMLLEDVYN